MRIKESTDAVQNDRGQKDESAAKRVSCEQNANAAAERKSVKTKPRIENRTEKRPFCLYGNIRNNSLTGAAIHNITPPQISFAKYYV